MIIGRASTIILISILTTRAIITLILRGWWRWRGSHSETTHDNLLSCNTTNTGVHLTQLIAESVKASIEKGRVIAWVSDEPKSSEPDLGGSSGGFRPQKPNLPDLPDKTSKRRPKSNNIWAS